MYSEDPVTTLTSKGQITIPRNVRDHLALTTGDQFELSVDSEGVIRLRKLTAVERVQKTLGAELRRQGVSKGNLTSLVEEAREQLEKDTYGEQKP